MPIELHIDRIVLIGGRPVSGSDAAALRQAVTAELARLLETTSTTTWRPAELRRITVPQVETTADPVGRGAAIARSVWAGLTAIGGGTP